MYNKTVFPKVVKIFNHHMYNRSQICEILNQNISCFRKFEVIFEIYLWTPFFVDHSDRVIYFNMKYISELGTI